MGQITGAQIIKKGTLENSDWTSTSGKELDADKVQHVYKAHTNFGLEIDDTPVAKAFVVYVATKAAIVRGFHAMLYDTGTSTSVSFDLKKNGTTILTGTVDITHSESDLEILDGTLASTALVEDDVLTIVLTVSSSTGALGPYAWADIEESTAP